MADDYQVLLSDGTTLKTMRSRQIGGVDHPVGLSINSSGVVASNNPTITASAYSPGYVVGGAIALANTALENARQVVLAGVTIKDAGNQKPPLKLLFFRAALGGTYADHAAFAWGGGDFAKFLGSVEILAAEYESLDNKAWVTKGGLDVRQDATLTTVVLVPVLRAEASSYTPASTTDLTFMPYHERR